MWFLNSCTSYHFCNNQILFSNLKAKSIDFVIAVEQIVWTEKTVTVSISLASDDNIKLHNVVLAPECNSNLISLCQLHEARITYHDNPLAMTLIQQRKVITYAKRTRNLFTLNLVHPGKPMTVTLKPKAIAITGWVWAIAITGQDQPTHLVSQNKHICL